MVSLTLLGGKQLEVVLSETPEQGWDGKDPESSVGSGGLAPASCSRTSCSRNVNFHPPCRHRVNPGPSSPHSCTHQGGGELLLRVLPCPAPALMPTMPTEPVPKRQGQEGTKELLFLPSSHQGWGHCRTFSAALGKLGGGEHIPTTGQGEWCQNLPSKSTLPNHSSPHHLRFSEVTGAAPGAPEPSEGF